MKKILFRKLLLDCSTFFLITLISASIIVWVFQAVNFLDIMIEDGRDYLVYINYTLLNFPKIISKILPFALFFSFSYVITKYELNNELIIFWNFGVHKILLVNFFLKFSIFLMLTQILLMAYIVPLTQNLSRTLVKTSNVDFFESFIKPKQFNDNIKGLTIYADEKNEDGSLKNIYLKKETGPEKFQITYAKTGFFKTISGSKVLVLYNGQTINGVKNKITTFNFTKSDFHLSQLDTDIIMVNKIQETSSLEIISCLKKYLNKDLTINKKQQIEIAHNCTFANLDNIFKELYKRFIIPTYIPILMLISLMLLIRSKENINYAKYRILIFLFGLFVIIFSETTLRFIQNTFFSNLKIILIPLIFFIILYFIFFIKLKVLFNFKDSSQ